MLVKKELVCYGNKKVRERAIAAGKDPQETFTAMLPEWQRKFDAETVTDFMAAYGFSTIEKLFVKFTKHLCDTKRSEFHRVGTGRLTDALKDQFMMDNNADFAGYRKLMQKGAKVEAENLIRAYHDMPLK